MAKQITAIEVDKIVSRMNSFASNTKNDDLSVEVARLAVKLTKCATNTFEVPLTPKEMRVVQIFQKDVEAA